MISFKKLMEVVAACFDVKPNIPFLLFTEWDQIFQGHKDSSIRW